MFSRNQFFRPIITTCLTKKAELQHARPMFRDKSYTLILRTNPQPEVISHFAMADQNQHLARINCTPLSKSTYWLDLLNLGKNYESQGTYDYSLKCYQRIIIEAKNNKLLTSSQKKILIDAYLRVASIIHIGSRKEEDQAMYYLDNVLQLDRNNIAAFELKRSILADRYEDISPAAVLTIPLRR